MRFKLSLRWNVLEPSAERSFAPATITVGKGGVVKAIVDEPILKGPAAGLTGAHVVRVAQGCLTMRLSDAGLRLRQTKLIYPDHRPSPWLTEASAPRSLQPIVRRLAKYRDGARLLP
jgi:hypothetical protein